MSKELLKTLLNYEFYENNKYRLNEDLFGDKDIKSLFKTITRSHEANKVSLNEQELKELHYAYNPTLTSAAKYNLDLLLDSLSSVDISTKVADSVLTEQINSRLYTELGMLAYEGADNKEIDVSRIHSILNELNRSSTASVTPEEFITDDIDELLEEVDLNFKWQFVDPLAKYINGIGEGTFTVIAARPNAGKTAFVVAMIYQPGGFLSQGAVVHLIGNEEKVSRTKLRGISSYTGLTKEEIKADPARARELFNEVKDRQFVKDANAMTLKEVEDHIKRHPNIDILIIDQLDKIRINGEFSRGDERIRELYTCTRELAKKYNIAIIGVCQASADADGKLYYGFECLEGSKTGKAAECDVCITIGKEGYNSSTQGTDNGFRMANLVKNKLGTEGSVGYILQHELSRMVP